MSKRNYNERRTLFALPYIIISILLVVVPLGLVFNHAFLDENGRFTFSNFSNFFDPAYGGIWNVIGNSFFTAFTTTLICFILSYPLALALLKISEKKRMLLVMLFILPMWINSFLRIVSIRLLLEPYIGLGSTLVIIGMVYEFMPFMFLPLYTIMVGIDKSLMEASSDLGASPIKTLMKVQLPLSVPGIVSGVLMVFMPTMSAYTISEILSGNKYQLLGNRINYWFGRDDYGTGSAYSIVLMMLIAAAVLISLKVSKGKSSAYVGGARA